MSHSYILWEKIKPINYFKKENSYYSRTKYNSHFHYAPSVLRFGCSWNENISLFDYNW